jgi:sugar lactone lactonase YvrE
MLDCDGTAGNGCETNGLTDATNCGSCGHDCSGEPCFQGDCEATLLVDAGAAIADIALDETNVYFTTPISGEVRFVPKQGGAATSLAANLESPEAIAVDDQDVFFATKTSIAKVAKSGGTPTVLASQQDTIWDLALDADFVYWATDRDCGALKRVPKNSTQRQTLSSDQGWPWAIAVDDSFLYWIDGQAGRVMKLDKSGAGVPVLLASRGSARRMAIDASGVYAQAGGDILSIASTGGEPVTLAADIADHLALDDTHVYWVGHGVSRVAKAGGTPERRTFSNEIGTAIAVDAAHVYFADSSHVLRSAK